MNKMKEIKTSYFQLLVAVGLWGTTFAISKVLLVHLSVISLIFFRMAFGFIALFIYLIFKRKILDFKLLWKNYKKMILIG